MESRDGRFGRDLSGPADARTGSHRACRSARTFPGFLLAAGSRRARARLVGLRLFHRRVLAYLMAVAGFRGSHAAGNSRSPDAARVRRDLERHPPLSRPPAQPDGGLLGRRAVARAVPISRDAAGFECASDRRCDVRCSLHIRDCARILAGAQAVLKIASGRRCGAGAACLDLSFARRNGVRRRQRTPQSGSRCSCCK